MILCTICKRPVKRATSEHDLRANAYVFTVECHGAVERVVVSEAEFVRADRVQFTKAFVGERRLP